MRAWLISSVEDIGRNRRPLQRSELPIPEPGQGEVRIRVRACGVCHTELDEIEGRTPPPRYPVVPGHQVVGHVDKLGPGCSRLALGDRVGVGWIHHSDGSAEENLSTEFVATGRDIDGGYADYMLACEAYAAQIPDSLSDEEAAPLLCAGAIGYRSLRLCEISDGDVLGLTGFGASGHLVLQLASAQYPNSPVYVFARSETEREFALELGASWAGDTTDTPPRQCRAIIDTTPAWKPVMAALECIEPGGRLVINAIRKSDTDRELLAGIRYEDHLWMEKEIKSVANLCFSDIEELIDLAARHGIRAEVARYEFDRANEAVCSLHDGGGRGARVLLL